MSVVHLVRIDPTPPLLSAVRPDLYTEPPKTGGSCFVLQYVIMSFIIH